jgi:hypothetical protein
MLVKGFLIFDRACEFSRPFKGSLVMRKKGGRDGGYRQVVWPQTAVINVFVFQAKKDISISAQQSKINRRFRLHFSVGNARRMFRCASPI